MDTLIQNLHDALRTLLRNPSFTLLAVVTLALGIPGPRHGFARSPKRFGKVE